jgi:hypothetical protein
MTTQPIMRSGAPVLTALPAHLTSAPVRASQPRVVATDDAPEKWYQIQNPLWVIVIGNALLFTVTALGVALG